MGCCSVRFAFAVAGSRAARSLLFSRWFSGLLAQARARDPTTKRCYLLCLVALEFPGWLAGCSFWAALSGASGRARATPCQPSGLGPGWGPESWHPRHHLESGVGVGNMHNLTSHIIAQDAFLNEHDMTWYNFKEAWPARGRRPRKYLCIARPWAISSPPPARTVAAALV